MHFKRLFILLFSIFLLLTLATLLSPLSFEDNRIRDIVILLTFIFIVSKILKANDQYFKKVIILGEHSFDSVFSFYIIFTIRWLENCMDKD